MAIDPHTRAPAKAPVITPREAAFIAALTHASKHRAELDASEMCGCFSCFRKFTTSEIHKWIDQNQTALCPKCGLDSVLGTASGLTIDDKFLRRMHQHHFGGGSK